MNESPTAAASDASVPTPADWRALLLHRLPDDVAAALEQRLLDDPEALAALNEAEADLFDYYARLRLTSVEHAAFEQHRLNTPESRERLRFAHALKPVVPRPAAARNQRFKHKPARRSRRTLWFSLTGAAIAVVLAVVSSIYLRNPDAALAAEKAALARKHAAEPTLVLLATVQRGAQRPTVRLLLADDAGDIRVQAEVEQPDENARYRLLVLGDEGAAAPLLTFDDIRLSRVGRYSFVEALLPTKLLAQAQRTIRIESQPPAAAFAFEWPVQAGVQPPEDPRTVLPIRP